MFDYQPNAGGLKTHEKAFVILLAFVISFFVGQVLSGWVVSLFDANFLSELDTIKKGASTEKISLMKLMQFISSVFTFVLPPIIIARILGKGVLNYLSLNTSPKIVYYGAIILFIFAIMPVMNLIIQLNESVKFPESLRYIETWMRSSEDSNKAMMDLMLTGSGKFNLLVNLVLIAVLPAIGEEFLFRGIIQKNLGEWLKNKHVAIFISAFLFSAIHFQFYGFFPRLLLGMFFGYLVYFSNSLWPAIFAHFMNNALAVIAYYFTRAGSISKDVESFGTKASDIYFVIIGIILAVLLGRILFRKRERIIVSEIETKNES
jgi:membrane protease YdiL (CAAX protease family)